jgi:hypothetical protein
MEQVHAVECGIGDSDFPLCACEADDQSNENEEDEVNRESSFSSHPHKIQLKVVDLRLGQHPKRDALAIHLNQRSLKLREKVTQ